MTIKDYPEYKHLEYGGRIYHVILNDEKNLLVVEANEQADSEGFYKCVWMVYEGCRIFGVVQSNEYSIKFNPSKHEIHMDELKKSA